MFLPRSVVVKSSGQRVINVSERTTSETRDCHRLEGTKQSSVSDGGERKGSEVSEGARHTSVKDHKEASSGSDEDEEPVVSYSKQQRWPDPGEPVCVICGRYGAYTVDRTDQDVCSLECKARHLLKLGMPLTPGPGSSGDVAGSREGVGSRGWSYMEHQQVAGMTTEQVDAFRLKMRIKVDGKHGPKPISDINHLGLPDKLMSNLQSAGYTSLTPSQMQVIPAILYQRDVLVCAATGSGKTLSFLLPIILHLIRENGGVASALDSSRETVTHSPRCLVLVPTRELAMQIEEQAKQLMEGLPRMKTALIVGGLPTANQLHRLRSGVELVVATPARLIDIMDNHSDSEGVDLTDIKIFVLDEVDCLLSMGFEPQVRRIEEMLPMKRQNLMFSATIPSSIAKMAKVMMSEPLTITIGEEASKKKKLLAFLSDKRHFNPPAVVFVSSKKGCLLLADTINKSCIPAATAVGLHGDMVQERRSEILQEFLEGKHSVLVATNVLGRGIDLFSVRQVFIFDMPSSLLDFIHQVGRAGRMGVTGIAITFINNTSKIIFLSFSDLMGRMGVVMPPQLSASPYLTLQREQRKRQASSTPSRPPPSKAKKAADSWKLRV